MCAILENGQTADGVRIPEPLRKYLPGYVEAHSLCLGVANTSDTGFREPEFLPFTKELPKDTTSQKAKAKAEKGAKPKVVAAATQAVEKVADKLKDAQV